MTRWSRRSPIRIRTSDPDWRRSRVTALALTVLLILAAVPKFASAQVRYDGQIYAMAYAWEAPAGEDGGRFDTYEGLRLRVRPGDALDFRSHVLFARRTRTDEAGSLAYEWEERVYQLYADARLSGRELTGRLGRQFVYRGTINGTFDALALRYRPAADWDVQVLAGLAAPYARDLDFSTESEDLGLWDERGSLGLFASKTFGRRVRTNVSWFQRNRGGDVAWSLAGVGFSAGYGEDRFVQAEVEYNVEQENTQRIRVRDWGEIGPVLVSIEFSTQRPRIFEDSFFSRFKVGGYGQARLGASYPLGPGRAGYEFVGTDFEGSERSGEHIVTYSLESGAFSGMIGVVYQSGYGGERFSPYVDARFEVLDGVTLRGNFTYLEYERRTISLDEDASAWTAGILVRPTSRWWLQLDVQQAANTFYDQDTRLLARAGVSF